MTNYEWLQKNGISLSDLRVAYINGLTVLYTVERGKLADMPGFGTYSVLEWLDKDHEDLE